MKVTISVEVSDLTQEEKERMALFGVNIEVPGLESALRNGAVTREDIIQHKEIIMSRMKAECIKSFKQRLVNDADKLITWDEDVFNNRLTAKLMIIPAKGVTREDFNNE